MDYLHDENDSIMRIAVEERTRPCSVNHLDYGDSGCRGLNKVLRNADGARVVKYHKNTINKND